MNNLVSIVVPTYNERENISAMTLAVHEALGSIPHEVLVADDNSPDGTWQEVESLRTERPWLRCLRRTGARGLSPAVIAGFEAASGDILGVMDADLSHDEKILPALVEEIRKGAELAVGSRRIPGGGATHWPWYRRITSWGATLLAKVLLRLDISDPMSGYFLVRRSFFESCKASLEPTGYKILLELYCKGRPARVAEIPFIFKDRRQGYSKLSSSVMKQYLAMVLRLRRQSRP